MSLEEEEDIANNNYRDDAKISKVNVEQYDGIWPVLAVAAYVNYYFWSTPLLVFLLINFKNSWWIVVPIGYILWVIYDKSSCEKSERRSEYFRRARIWKLMGDYFPLTLVKTAELPADKNYVFGLHPHGMASFSHLLNFGTESTGFSRMFPGIKSTLVAHEYMFLIPFFREMIIWLGIRSVSSRSIDWLLSRQKTGRAVSIVIGGVKGAFNAGQDQTLLKLKARKGFVKKALIHGASLVPVFTYGEDDLFTCHFKQGTIRHRIIHKIFSMTRIPVFIFTGRGGSLMPHRARMVTVIGKPIFVDKSNPNPTEEQVNTLHKQYLHEIWQLYEENKHLYPEYRCKPLQFI